MSRNEVKMKFLFFFLTPFMWIKSNSGSLSLWLVQTKAIASAPCEEFVFYDYKQTLDRLVCGMSCVLVIPSSDPADRHILPVKLFLWPY